MCLVTVTEHEVLKPQMFVWSCLNVLSPDCSCSLVSRQMSTFHSCFFTRSFPLCRLEHQEVTGESCSLIRSHDNNNNIPSLTFLLEDMLEGKLLFCFSYYCAIKQSCK